MFAGRHSIQEKHSNKCWFRPIRFNTSDDSSGRAQARASQPLSGQRHKGQTSFGRKTALFAHRRLTRVAGVTLQLAGTKRLIWGFQLGDHQNFPGPFSNNQKKQKEKGGATIDPTDKAPKNDNKKVPGDKTGT